MNLKPAVAQIGEVVAACPAVSQGQWKREGAAVALGGAIAGIGVLRALQAGKTEPTAPGGHIGSIYVTLGRDRIAFWEEKKGIAGASLGRLLAAHSRSAVRVCDWKPAKLIASTLIIVAGDDAHYELGIALSHKGKAQKIIDALREGVCA